MECSIINPALSLLMKRLVIGQRRKAPNFSAFHWSPHGSLVSIGQHFVVIIKRFSRSHKFIVKTTDIFPLALNCRAKSRQYEYVC